MSAKIYMIVGSLNLNFSELDLALQIKVSQSLMENLFKNNPAKLHFFSKQQQIISYQYLMMVLIKKAFNIDGVTISGQLTIIN